MRNIILQIIMLLTSSLASFCQSPTRSFDDSQNIAYKDNKEEFYSFILDFSLNREFQLLRVLFPFPDCSFNNNSKDMEIVCDSILLNKWEQISFVDSTSGIAVIKTFINNFDGSEIESDERVYQIFKPETDFAIRYYFKNINGKWFLIKRRNFSY